ncbi:hypothetical protein F5Y17DRAFT_53649 [Xylariaceae sp. FL0594]|nr:hypothetical protein F5Y17DRAFT_53649 [Xylariaceae sp. FL0594]
MAPSTAPTPPTPPFPPSSHKNTLHSYYAAPSQSELTPTTWTEVLGKSLLVAVLSHLGILCLVIILDQLFMQVCEKKVGWGRFIKNTLLPLSILGWAGVLGYLIVGVLVLERLGFVGFVRG